MRRRILFISRTLRGGGAERFVSVFASHLADQGYDVHILLYEESADDYKVSNHVNVNIMPPIPNNKIGKIERVLRMKSALSKINPDVVIPFVDTVVVCTYLANLWLKKMFVFTVRVSPWHEDINSTKFAKVMRKHIAKHADKIMIQTKEQGEFFDSNTKLRQYVVSNPVAPFFLNHSKANYRNEITTIVTVGRLEKQKNIPLLIEAFADIRNHNNNINLLIYGEGSEKQALEKLIIKHQLEDCCFLMGRSNQISEVYEKADLFVLTSDFEGMPNALIEAMAYGVPCISSDCQTGPKDLISNNDNGLLFETGNVNSLISCFKYAIDNVELMNEIGKRGRSFVSLNYNIEKIEKDFITMLSD